LKIFCEVAWRQVKLIPRKQPTYLLVQELTTTPGCEEMRGWRKDKEEEIRVLKRKAKKKRHPPPRFLLVGHKPHGGGRIKRINVHGIGQPSMCGGGGMGATREVAKK